MNKTTGLLLAGVAIGAGIYFLSNQSSNYNGYNPGTYLPPGGTYGGYTNTSNTAQIITATGTVLDALGNVLGNILSNLPGASSGGGNANGENNYYDEWWGVEDLIRKPEIGSYHEGGLM